MKFAVISCANFNGKYKKPTYDIFNWCYVLDAMHYYVLDIRDNISVLNNYDVVIFLDVDRYLDNAIQICQECTCKTVFFPEGTIQIYLKMPFDHQKLFYELLQSVDLIGAAEENMVDWYETVFSTKAFFMHIPITDDFIKGSYRNMPKRDVVMVCCNLGMDQERHKTNLITSLGILRKLGKKCILCDVQKEQIPFFKEKMGVNVVSCVGRASVDEYLKGMRQSVCLLAPSAIIGTSRNAIAGAAVGTPVIGNRDSHTQQRLWPALGTYIYDTEEMISLVNQLYEQKDFYNQCCDYAFEELQFYSTENAKKRFMDAAGGLF